MYSVRATVILTVRKYPSEQLPPGRSRANLRRRPSDHPPEHPHFSERTLGNA